MFKSIERGQGGFRGKKMEAFPSGKASVRGRVVGWPRRYWTGPEHSTDSDPEAS